MHFAHSTDIMNMRKESIFLDLDTSALGYVIYIELPASVGAALKIQGYEVLITKNVPKVLTLSVNEFTHNMVGRWRQRSSPQCAAIH